MHQPDAGKTSRAHIQAVVALLIGLVIVVGASAAVPADARPSAREVQTLYTLEGGGLQASAAEGRRIAWVRDDGRGGAYIEVLDTSSRKRTVIGFISNRCCNPDSYYWGTHSFAIGGGDAEYLRYPVAQGMDGIYELWRASTRTRKARLVGSPEEHLIVGGGGMLVYRTSRSIRRIVDGRDSFFARARGVTALAAAPGLVAFAQVQRAIVDRSPGKRQWYRARRLTAPSSSVRTVISVRRASDGKLRWRRAFPSEDVMLDEVSRSFVTVRRGNLLEVHDARTGVHRRTWPVPADSAVLGISGLRAILGSPKRGITVLDLRSGRKSVRPIRWKVPYGHRPWVLGRRVVWVDEAYRGMRIRAVTLD